MWRATTHVRSGIRCVGLRPGLRRLSTKPPASGKETKSASQKPKANVPPPAEPPPRPSRVPKLLGGLVLLSGAGAGLYWYDPSILDWVKEQLNLTSAPSTEKVPAEIWPPPLAKKKPIDAPPSQQQEIKTPAPEITGKPNDTDLAEKRKKEQEEKDKKKLEKEQKMEAKKKSAEEERKKHEEKKKQEERMKDEEIKKREEEKKQAERTAHNSALLKNLDGPLEDVNKIVTEALETQSQVLEKIKAHTQSLKRALDDNSPIEDKDGQWQSVVEASQAWKQIASVSDSVVNKAREELGRLNSVIQEVKENADVKANKVVTAAEDRLSKLTSQMDLMVETIKKSESEYKTTEQFTELIEKGKMQFQRELQSLMPDKKLGAGKGQTLSEEELNLLIGHAHGRIEQLQLQLAEQIAMEKQRLQAAIDYQKREDDHVANLSMNNALEKLQQQFAMEKENWATEAHEDYEKELRHMLAMQASAHVDNLGNKLAMQELELAERFDAQLQDKILEERLGYKTQIAGCQARLGGIEAAVEVQAEKGKAGQQAKKLWLACLALNGLIRVGNKSGESWEEQVAPLEGKVVAIAEASGHHPFVATIINTIPEAALTRGVWTEDNLNARFRDVSRKCRRVALVNESRSSLFTFFLSYVQSFFVFSNVNLKMEETTVDPKDLDTFSIVDHAQFWLKQGNLELAVRFMNQLEGLPRALASDWIREGKLLMETKQAAQSITTFASATGLGALF
ncbi:MICOS complex subunit Mic60-like isoform X1 [Mizuhopecten yessoensis]|uniref:MICOS complex subunit Mic60-like isoform X1 n=1 Tax=Mizuhopecten yessoensis TaxID=6573 RepID=UPI000B45F7AF|nr:MICOS complex subunit Mic60-like isoform X1 [Mizuhopecten yessoensis]